jgi:hypothetical protein
MSRLAVRALDAAVWGEIMAWQGLSLVKVVWIVESWTVDRDSAAARIARTAKRSE